MADHELNAPPLHGRAVGWPDIAEVIEAQLLQALASKTRRIVLLDPDFRQWPLSSPALLEAIRLWSHNGARKLELAAPDWSHCARAHPRLLAWRRSFDHCLQIHQFEPQEVGPDWPCALLAVQGGVVLRVLELDEGRAVWSQEAGDRQIALELFDAIAQRSSAGWPLTTLGL